jgi:hypothetical protein
MGGIRFRDDHNATGIFIEPMHDPRAPLATNTS